MDRDAARETTLSFYVFRRTSSVFGRLLNLVSGESRREQLIGPLPPVSGFVVQNCRRPRRVGVGFNVGARDDRQHRREQESSGCGVVSRDALISKGVLRENDLT